MSVYNHVIISAFHVLNGMADPTMQNSVFSSESFVALCRTFFLQCDRAEFLGW